MQEIRERETVNLYIFFIQIHLLCLNAKFLLSAHGEYIENRAVVHVIELQAGQTPNKINILMYK